MYFTDSSKKPSKKQANTEIKTLYNKSSASSVFCGLFCLMFLQRHRVTRFSRVHLLVIEQRAVESCAGGRGGGGGFQGHGGPDFYLATTPAAPVRDAGCSFRLTRSVALGELSENVSR